MAQKTIKPSAEPKLREISFEGNRPSDYELRLKKVLNKKR